MSGARRKEQRWDPKENEQIVTEGRVLYLLIWTDFKYSFLYDIKCASIYIGLIKFDIKASDICSLIFIVCVACNALVAF